MYSIQAVSKHMILCFVLIIHIFFSFSEYLIIIMARFIIKPRFHSWVVMICLQTIISCLQLQLLFLSVSFHNSKINFIFEFWICTEFHRSYRCRVIEYHSSSQSALICTILNNSESSTNFHFAAHLLFQIF